MNINDFEDYIEGHIVSRGENYYDNDCVVSVEELGNHRYSAAVEGNDIYEITVQLDGEHRIISCECDCPYDQGDYCKHEVAVFYELRDRLEEHEEAAAHKGTSDLKEILMASNKEDLVHFLLTLAKESDEMVQRIKLKFVDNNIEDELQQCKKLIKFYIARHSEKDGFIPYRNVEDALTGVGMVLGKAQDYLENQEYVQAVKLCIIVIHAMVNLLETTDDSAGYIGDAITNSLDLIESVAQVEASIGELEKDILFELLTEESTDEIYEGWTDWSLSLLSVCVVLTDTSDKRVVLEEHFQQMIEDNQENSWIAERLSEQITNLRYQLILKLDGEAQAAEFNRSHLSLSRFRERAIKTEIATSNYKQAEQLALEGEEQDQEWSGLVLKWKELRYEVYKRSNQLELQQNLAVEFVLNNQFSYYEELKKTYASADWPQVYPQLIELLEKHKHTFQSVYTKVLVEEKEWAKLLEYVKEEPDEIEVFYSYLTEGYPNEVYDLFNQHIEKKASQASSRKQYKEVIKVIRLFKKAGKDAPVQETVQKLLDLYARKPAFQDELSNI